MSRTARLRAEASLVSIIALVHNGQVCALAVAQPTVRTSRSPGQRGARLFAGCRAAVRGGASRWRGLGHSSSAWRLRRPAGGIIAARAISTGSTKACPALQSNLTATSTIIALLAICDALETDWRQDSNHCISGSEFTQTLSPGGRTRTCASRIASARAALLKRVSDADRRPSSPFARCSSADLISKCRGSNPAASSQTRQI